MIKVFVGYDPIEAENYAVLTNSITRLSSQPVAITPLNLMNMPMYKEVHTDGSTQFSYSRFLTPFLMEFQGWAIYMDSDMLALKDIADLWQLRDNRYAVQCVKHDYTPQEGDKMDGCKQMPYPRKNWSSMILWNCGHPANATLVPELINDENNSGQFFHRFQWLDDQLIGELSHEYNWLVNWYHEPKDGQPKAIHYTEGGPWFDNYKFCEYGYQWAVERNQYEKSLISPPVVHKFSTLPNEMNNIIDKMLEYRMDSNNEYYTVTRKELIDEIDKNLSPKRVFAVDSEF